MSQHILVVLKSINGDGVASCFFTGDGRGQVFVGGAGVFEIEAGKIKTWRDYFNFATYQRALA